MIFYQIYTYMYLVIHRKISYILSELATLRHVQSYFQSDNTLSGGRERGLAAFQQENNKKGRH